MGSSPWTQALPGSCRLTCFGERPTSWPREPPSIRQTCIDDPQLLAKARTDLAQAIVYLAELRSYMPTGETHVPLSAFWGDAPRVDREQRAERYSRTWIDAALARWEAELERFGQRPTSNVRSAEEAYVFMAIHPCPRCGTETPHLQSRIEADGDDLISTYGGPCTRCGLQRNFRFRLPDVPFNQTDDVVALGRDRSSCLDAGQFLIAADLFARRADASRGGAAIYALQLAIASIDEILKLIAGDEEKVVPELTIASRAGWAIYEQEPGRFGEVRLRALRNAYCEVVDGAA